MFQPAGNFFAALDDSGDEGAKPKAAQPKKKETGKQSAAVPTQPAKKNDDHKRYVVRKCLLVMTKLSPAVCLSFIYFMNWHLSDH